MNSSLATIYSRLALLFLIIGALASVTFDSGTICPIIIGLVVLLLIFGNLNKIVNGYKSLDEQPKPKCHCKQHRYRRRRHRRKNRC